MRLNLVSGGADYELEEVRRRIDSFETAWGLEQVLATLRAYARRGARAEVLDAIGHSRSPGFLQLGTWSIDDTPQTGASFSELLRPSLEQLGVRIIRLLGCSTATTERGRQALRRVSYATRCEVVGTKRYLSKSDYGAAGFMSDHVLLTADGKEVACSRVRIEEVGIAR